MLGEIYSELTTEEQIEYLRMQEDTLHRLRIALQKKLNIEKEQDITASVTDLEIRANTVDIRYNEIRNTRLENKKGADNADKSRTE